MGRRSSMTLSRPNWCVSRSVSMASTTMAMLGPWLGVFPGWTAYVLGQVRYQSRHLSDGGRVFFNSSDGLVPQDVNGTWDVYEYEPEGVGSYVPAAASGSVVYRPAGETTSGVVEPAGCVGLISNGQSAEQSAFMDASENGDDVFFLTAAKLVGEDFDAGYDLYDAHVCTSLVPCVTAPVAPPPCTSGESCRSASATQLAIFGAPSSATFNGAGNLSSEPDGAVKPKAKPLTRAQKLAKALKVCDKRPKKQRAGCERRARRKYGR